MYLWLPGDQNACYNHCTHWHHRHHEYLIFIIVALLLHHYQYQIIIKDTTLMTILFIMIKKIKKIHPQPGLQTPFNLTAETNITAIKCHHRHHHHHHCIEVSYMMIILITRYFNNTHRHLGQMAQWTGLMVYDTDPY